MQNEAEVIEQSLRLPWWLTRVLSDKVSDRRFWITKGLGSGGTYGLAIWHYLMCLTNYRSKFSWSIAPTFQQVADTLIPTFGDVLTNVFNLVELRDFEIVASQRPRVLLKQTGQEIHFKSANRPDRLVGPSVSHISGTEVGLWERLAYEKSSARLRCPKAFLTQYLGEGTPEGMNWWEQEANFEEGINEIKNAHRVILWTSDNTHLKPQYADNLKRIYEHDQTKLESYFYGRFVPFTRGSAYWDFVQSRCVVLDVAPSPALPILLCFDFNVSPLSWVVMQEQPFEKNGRRSKRFVVLAESDGKQRGLEQACQEFRRKFPVAEWGRVPIQVYGDPSGYFGSHKSPSCDFDVIYQNLRNVYQNVSILADRDAPRVRNRLERHNTLFAFGRLAIAAWCQNTIRSHVQTCLKPGTWTIDKPKNDDWTHFADAIGYPLFQLTRGEDLENPDRKKILGLNKII